MRRSICVERLIFLAAAIPAFVAPAVAAEKDPITACRAAHGDDFPARVSCLEAAIQTLTGEPAPPASAASEDASPVHAERAEAPTGLGAEQVLARRSSRGEAPKEDKPPKERITVQISEIVYTRTGRTLFFTEDGQIWRETDSQPVGRRLSTKKQYLAEITQSMFGGYRMDIDGVRRIIKVERLE